MKKYFSLIFLVLLSASIVISAQKANPASDFEYELYYDSTGINITKYKGTSKDVIIPSTIEDLQVVALESASFADSKIVSVTIPNCVIVIGSYCFGKCKYLEKVTLPKDLKYIFSKCFYKCEALKEIVLPPSIEKIEHHLFSESGLESIIIPDSVQVIEQGAFKKCSALTNITIPDSVQMIGSDAFASCTSLASVTVGKGIRQINSAAFINCSSLTSFNIGEHKLKDGSFKLRGQSYSGGYGGLGYGAFRGCSSLSLKEQKKIRDTGYSGGF